MKRKNVNIFNVLGLLALIVFLFTSCYKTDFDKISDNVTWKPDVSLPVGETEISFTSVPDKELPFHHSEFLYDTLNFSVSDFFVTREEVDSMMFRINLVNEFPAGCEIIIFYLEDGQEFDYDRSLTGDEPIVIAPGKIDGEGKSTIPSKKQVDIWLTSTQVDQLFTSTMLVVRVFVRDIIVTQPVKDNFTSYRLKTVLGLRAKLVYDQ